MKEKAEEILNKISRSCPIDDAQNIYRHTDSERNTILVSVPENERQTWRTKMSLEEYGFTEAGRWQLYPKVRSGITFGFSDFGGLENERVVYAFVVGDVVKYIGVCQESSTTLKDRMSRYKSLAGGGANKRIANKMLNCLNNEQSVKIFALKPEQSCHYYDLAVDLVKGLENPLIQKFRPEWNKQV